MRPKNKHSGETPPTWTNEFLETPENLSVNILKYLFYNQISLPIF
jgi:hypothetical protein